MRLANFERLIDRGGFSDTAAFHRVERDLQAAVDHVRWPEGNNNFTIYPERNANGVRPIKIGFITMLVERGWKLERRALAESDSLQPGAFDAWLDLEPDGYPPFVTEWETGNISSSHRALNKIGLGLLRGQISGGVVVLPTRPLYTFLTDRVGNYSELAPYFPFWRAFPVDLGFLGVISVEHEGESFDVPRIPKGTDGRALG